MTDYQRMSHYEQQDSTRERMTHFSVKDGLFWIERKNWSGAKVNSYLDENEGFPMTKEVAEAVLEVQELPNMQYRRHVDVYMAPMRNYCAMNVFFMMRGQSIDWDLVGYRPWREQYDEHMAKTKRKLRTLEIGSLQFNRLQTHYNNMLAAPRPPLYETVRIDDEVFALAKQVLGIAPKRVDLKQHLD